jgi:hypothetical protein
VIASLSVHTNETNSFASISFIRIRVSLRTPRKLVQLYDPLRLPKWFVTFAFTIRRRDTEIPNLAAREASQLSAGSGSPSPLRQQIGKPRKGL